MAYESSSTAIQTPMLYAVGNTKKRVGLPVCVPDLTGNSLFKNRKFLIIANEMILFPVRFSVFRK